MSGFLPGLPACSSLPSLARIWRDRVAQQVLFDVLNAALGCVGKKWTARRGSWVLCSLARFLAGVPRLLLSPSFGALFLRDLPFALSEVSGLWRPSKGDGRCDRRRPVPKPAVWAGIRRRVFGALPRVAPSEVSGLSWSRNCIWQLARAEAECVLDRWRRVSRRACGLVERAAGGSNNEGTPNCLIC